MITILRIGMALVCIQGVAQLNAADHAFTKITAGDIVAATGEAWGCSWGDYDNDGFIDLFVTNSRGNALFRNNGDGTFTRITSGPVVTNPTGGSGAAWGDYDNDGFMDLFVANGGTQQQENFLYHNDGNGNSWLKVRLVGTSSNRSAIGARVRVRATIGGQSLWQMREVTAGDSFMSQQDIRPNFGLGDAAAVDRIRIEWPSGIVQELHGVAANQILTVTEPARLDPSAAHATGRIELKVNGWPGFVYDLESSMDLEEWTRVATLTNETGTVVFSEPLESSPTRRYYRAVSR